MASTPSSSALTAVLRCRGNFLTRNPPTKRPSSSSYSLGLTRSPVCDSPAEKPRAHRVPTWEAFLRGERLVVVGILTVQYNAPPVNGRTIRGKDFRGTDHPKLGPEDAHSAAPGGPNALARQLAFKLTSNLLVPDTCSHVIQMIKHAQISDIVFVHGASEQPTGVLKVTISSSEKAEQMFSILSALRSTCLSLTALVSDVMFRNLAVLCRSFSRQDDEPRHLPQKIARTLKNGPKSSKDDSVYVKKMSVDRPD